MSTLAERIQIRLKATRKNANSVGVEIGRDRSIISDILLGKSKRPSLATILALCDPLECSLAYLAGVEPETQDRPSGPAQSIGEPLPSQRDSFAATALVGMRLWCPDSAKDDRGLIDLTSPEALQARADWAYAQADAMLKAREA